MCSLIVNPHLFPSKFQKIKLSQSNLLTESELQSCIFFLILSQFFTYHFTLFVLITNLIYSW